MQKLPIITALSDVEIKKIYGQSILDFHQQVSRLLEKEDKDGEFSNFFAEPVVNIQHGEINWYTIYTGECISVAKRDDYQRFLISEKLNSICEKINRIRSEVSRGQGGNSLGAEAIQGMLTAPDLMRSLFLVGDKLVLTEWGCTPFGSIPDRFDLIIPENRKLDRALSVTKGEMGAAIEGKSETLNVSNPDVKDEHTLDKESHVLGSMDTVQEDTVSDQAPPVSSLSNSPVSSRRIFLPWILFLQLFIIGNLLLLFFLGIYNLRWNSKIEEIENLKSEIEHLWKKAEAKSKSCMVNNSDGTQSKDDSSKGIKKEDKNGSEQKKIDVFPPSEGRAGPKRVLPDRSELPSPRPIAPVAPEGPVGPDTISPVIPGNPSVPSPPDGVRPVSPDQSTRKPNRKNFYRSGPGSSDLVMQIPSNTRDLAFLQGCWRVNKDLKEITTGSQLESRICFSGTEGVGTFEYRFPDGRRCHGSVRSRRNGTTLLMDRSKLTCADGAFPPALIRCSGGNDQALCEIIEIIDGKIVPRSQQLRDAKLIRISNYNLKHRLQIYGTSRGRLEISLAWDTKDDLDLSVTCPDLSNISWRNRQACGAKLVLDMNVSDAAATSKPVEHIVWNEFPEFREPLRIAALLHRVKSNIEGFIPYRITVMLDNKVIGQFHGELSFLRKRIEQFKFTVPLTSETRRP
jgi:hypothetical protein